MYSTDVLWSRKHDCWGNWIRQHKETLSRVSGMRKKEILSVKSRLEVAIVYNITQNIQIIKKIVRKFLRN